MRRGGWRAAPTAEGQPPGRACWRPRPPGSVSGRARSRRALASRSVPLRPRDGAGGAINAASDNYLDNGATEQVFGHLKDEFFRGREWPDFESFKADLDAYVVHWNTRRRQVRLKGLTPEEFRNQALGT